MPQLGNPGVKCPCCQLKLADELYPFVVRALNKTERNYTMCIGCKRDCRGRKTCHLGELDA